MGLAIQTTGVGFISSKLPRKRSSGPFHTLLVLHKFHSTHSTPSSRTAAAKVGVPSAILTHLRGLPTSRAACLFTNHHVKRHSSHTKYFIDSQLLSKATFGLMMCNENLWLCRLTAGLAKWCIWCTRFCHTQVQTFFGTSFAGTLLSVIYNSSYGLKQRLVFFQHRK
jgi:hypothetical protein